MSIPTTSYQTSTVAQRQRHAVRVVVILLGAIVLNAIFSFRLGVQSGAWQHFARGGVVVGFGLATLYGFQLIRKDRVAHGIWLIIVAFLVTMTITAGLLADLGVVTGLIEVLIVSMIAAYVLPPEQVSRAIAISVGVAVVALLIEFIDPVFRLPAPTQFKTVLPVLAGIVVLLNAILILRQFKSYSLSGKLIAVLTGMTAVVTLTIGGFFIYRILTGLRGRIIDEHSRDAEIIAGEMETFLDNAQFDIQFLSQSLAVERYLAAVDNGTQSDRAEAIVALEAEFRTFARNRPIYDQIRFMDAAGQEIVRINRESGSTYQVAEQEVLQNKSQRYYFQDSINLPLGGVFISALDLNVENGQIELPYKPMIRYGTPVFSDGQVAGVVVTNVLADNLMLPLSEDKDDTFMVDANGYFLYHSDESRRWGRDLETGITVSQEYPELAPRLFSDSISTFTDVDQFFAFAPVTIPGESTPRWYLSTLHWNDDLFAPVAQMQNTVLALLGAAIMASALMAVAFSRVLARPLMTLTQAAERLAQGDWSVRVSLDSQDEVGTLAHAFNTMADHTQDAIDSLETRVAERTQELALAAEVGHNVSQVQEVSEVLATAVAIIRDRFNLYYTQIYLMDNAGRNLILKEGTGDVGTKLVARAHHLPVGHGSINGLAAAEKRAVIVPDTEASPTFFANPLLPDTRSEMAVPLLIGSRVVGVLDLQSSQANSLTEAVLPAFEALAGQLAIAIENAELFTEATEARLKVEAQARRLIHTGWEDFLNVTDHREYIGYHYENGEIESLSEPIGVKGHDDRLLDMPVMISGESVGTIRLKMAAGQKWTSDDAVMVDAVAQQVAQQLESLRLLSEAERYRAEAETAVRRLTREGWDGYLETADLTNTGYLYDQNQVVPLTAELNMPIIAGDSLSHDLVVQGETIGYLNVAETEEMDDSADELVTAVAQQLSAHIENLRLTIQTEEALAETAEQARRRALINTVSERLNRAETLDEIYEVVAEGTAQILPSDRVSLAVLNDSGDQFSIMSLAGEGKTVPLGAPLPLADSMIERAIKAGTVIVTHNPESNPGEGINSSMIAPLITGVGPIGTLNVGSKATAVYDDADRDLILQIASILSSVIENKRLFAEAQQRAQREQLLRQITESIHTAVDAETVMRTAAREIGRLLGLETYVYLTAPGDLDKVGVQERNGTPIKQ